MSRPGACGATFVIASSLQQPALRSWRRQRVVRADGFFRHTGLVCEARLVCETGRSLLVPIGFALQSVCASVRYLATRSTEPMFGEAGPEAPLSRPEGCVVTLLERPYVPVPLLKREPIRILFCKSRIFPSEADNVTRGWNQGDGARKGNRGPGCHGKPRLLRSEAPACRRNPKCRARGRICPLLVTWTNLSSAGYDLARIWL